MLVLVVYWLTLITATHIPRVPEPLGFRPSDKVVHLLAYAVFGALAGLAWSLRWGLSWRAALGLWLLLAAHGILDEVTQPIFGRHADVLDWYADMLGAAVGLAMVGAARQCWLRMRTQRRH
jgi:VanZ family protein